MSNPLKSITRRAALALAAASMLAGASVSAFAQGVTIPVIVKDTTSSYWQVVLAGARAAGKELGISVPELGAQSEADINGQISILENAVAGKPAAVVIAPTEAKALGSPITEAAKSVPIVGIDSSAESQSFSSFLTTDNTQGGRVAADGLAAAIQKKTGKIEGDVALLTYLPGAGSLNQRVAGFKEQIAAKYPGLKLVADKYGDGTTTTALNITTDLLTSNPNMVGMFATNLYTAQGAGQVVAENGLKDKFALVGFDSDDKLIKLLEDGNIDALIVQDPYRMGYDGVKTALAVSKGEKVEKNVDTGANLVTKDNMKDAKIDALLHPKM